MYNIVRQVEVSVLRYFLWLFIVLPACELGLLLWSGKTFGVLATVAMIIITGVGGAYLAKYQGMLTVRKVQEQINRGIMPGEEMINGMCVLLGGILLISPGFITDILGLLLLLPLTRNLIKPFIKKVLYKKAERNTITIIG